MADDRRGQLAANRRRGVLLDNPLDDVADKTARQATGRAGKGMTAGRFVRRQFTFWPETLTDLKTMAAELGTTEAEAARWCMERGLKAFLDGEMPDTKPSGGVQLERPR